MSTTSTRSRKGAALAFICILLFVCIVFLPQLAHRFSRAVPSVTPQVSSSVQVDVIGPRTSPRQETTRTNTPSALQDRSNATPASETPASDDNNLVPVTPALPGAIVAGVAGSTTVAVVDLGRILAEYQSGADTQQQRSNALQRIKGIAAARAAARNFRFVFDLSAKSPNGAPFIVATNGVPDITEEILQELIQ